MPNFFFFRSDIDLVCKKLSCVNYLSHFFCSTYFCKTIVKRKEEADTMRSVRLIAAGKGLLAVW